MSYGDEENREENLKWAKTILPFVRKMNKADRRVGSRSIAVKFGLSRYYVEWLATHYITEMSAYNYPGEVLQVTQKHGWIISNDFVEDSRKVQLGKRKAANTIRKRTALITSVVGNVDEKRLAQRALASCEIEKIDIEMEEEKF